MGLVTFLLPLKAGRSEIHYGKCYSATVHYCAATCMRFETGGGDIKHYMMGYIFRLVRKITKGEYYLCHVLTSFRASAWNNSAPIERIS